MCPEIGLVIRDGRVVTQDGIIVDDLVITGGCIASVGGSKAASQGAITLFYYAICLLRSSFMKACWACLWRLIKAGERSI